jgi:hypothetical protein
MSNEEKSSRRYYGHEQRKQSIFKSPDISQLQEVIIDARTKMYIPLGASAEEARNRYHHRGEVEVKAHGPGRKPLAEK